MAKPEVKEKLKTDTTDVDEPLSIPIRGGLDPADSNSKIVTSGTIYEAAAKFEDLGLSKELLEGVYDMKFTRPSKIQAVALPIIVSKDRNNLIAQAHHGSGKTAAYTLGMLSRVDPKKAAVQAMCLCPSRELTIQVAEVASKLAKFTSIKIYKAIAGSSRETIRDQIIVGTPGTVLAKLRAREIDPSGISVFVCDEADVMILQGSEGMGDQTMNVRRQLPSSCQILLFSATFPERVRTFALSLAPNASKIILKREELTLDGIKQFFIETKGYHQKYDVLTKIYGLLEIGQSIIFVHTRTGAKELCEKMRKDNYKCSLLHGADMSAEERDRVMDDFKTGKTTVLISTNVLARGIDVLQVTLVVNYDIPITPERKPDFDTYIHRIGRSGRFGRKGVAINLVHDFNSKSNLGEIANYFGAKITQLPTNDWDSVESLVRKALGKQEKE